MVLLQVIAATSRGDAPRDLARRELRAEDVQDLAVGLLHVDDLDLPEAASVRRLAAAFGIERRPVEDRRRAAIEPPAAITFASNLRRSGSSR